MPIVDYYSYHLFNKTLLLTHVCVGNKVNSMVFGYAHVGGML